MCIRRAVFAAFTAVAQGYFVFPLHPGSKIPAITRWEQNATRDPHVLADWWRTTPRNIGIATGQHFLQHRQSRVLGSLGKRGDRMGAGFRVLARRVGEQLVDVRRC